MWFKLNDGNKAKPCTPQTQSRRAKRGEGFPPWSGGSKLDKQIERSPCESWEPGVLVELSPLGRSRT